MLSETKPVFKKIAHDNNSKLINASALRFIQNSMIDQEFQTVIIKDYLGKIHEYELSLLGKYQLKNLVVVLAAIEILNKMGFTITEDSIKRGFKHVKQNTNFRGRWEVLSESPKIIVDVAHNLPGIQSIVNQIDNIDGDIHIVFGIVEGKKEEEIFKILPKDAKYYFCELSSIRSLKIKVLENLAKENKLKSKVFENVQKAISNAMDSMKFEDTMIILGSFYLVSEAINIIEK